MASLPARAEQPAPALQGVVVWVYDGDTLEIDPVGKVRLLGIDVPEQEPSSRDRYLAERGVSASRQRQISRAAKQFNISRVKGKRVNLHLDETHRDRHGRLLAYVYLPDGRLLNRLLVEKGLAVVYRRFSFAMQDDFMYAEAQAMANRTGLWAEADLR